MGKKLSKLLGVFCVGLLFALCGMSASAAETQENVMYLDENGEEKTASATVVESVLSNAPVTEVTWQTGWYVVVSQDPVTYIHGRIRVQGDVHLILSDGASLSAYSGINVPVGSSLTIYAQSYSEETMGRLGDMQEVETNSGRAFIGGDANESCGTIIINGGNITVGCPGEGAAGIGGGVNGNGGAITVNGGIIRGLVKNGAAFIGGGVNGAGGNITITGGTFKDEGSSGIGSGVNGGPCNIVIRDVEEQTSYFDYSFNTPGVSTFSLINAKLNHLWLDCDGTITIQNSELIQDGGAEIKCDGSINIDNSTIDGNAQMAAISGSAIITINNSDVINVNGKQATLQGGKISGRLSFDTMIVENAVVDCSIEADNLIINGGEILNKLRVYETITMLHGGAIHGLELRNGLVLVDGGAIFNGKDGSPAVECYGDSCGVIIDQTQEGAVQGTMNAPNAIYFHYDDNQKMIADFVGYYSELMEFSIEEGWELRIHPGAWIQSLRVNNNGTILVAGTLDTDSKIKGNSPYYAINADSETVASVSAGDSIVWDGVTFVPEGEVVTLKSKGTGAMHWAAQPAYLNVTNNKFYMPDEVVSVKASALPLETTPTIQVDGEKLTGFTAGEYYSISDAIFRPTGTTLPIRPEWYGTTVSIVKLGDGFATGDSFAQALAIPSQSGGTVTPPNPGGGTGSKPDPDDPEEIVIPDGDWEEAEEELSQADSGDTVIVETDEDDTLPDEVLESAAGKNVTLKIKVGDSIFWEIDCRVIPKDASLQDIFLQVSMNTQGIPSKVLCGLPGSHTFLQMTLGHDGLFGFPVKLHADVGRGNSGKWANLYYYNEGTGKMEFETAARVTASGDAAFTMTHASQYAIVLDEKSHALSFQDVGEGAWFQGAVEYVYRAGLMAGTGDTTFEPNAKLTRAMTAQILYNLEGQPEVTGEATFSDMNTAPDWSMDAIAWAQDTGVVAGMGDNTFAPNLKVTREQFAQMLYNYAKYKKCDLTKAGDLTKFPDEVSISTWAETALSWANGNGLINGHENGTLDPQGNTVRGQAASILMNFDLNVVKSVA